MKITPFNIDEELEDGHYDETGSFQWKKKDVNFHFGFFLLFFENLFRKKKFMMHGLMKSIGQMSKITN